MKLRDVAYNYLKVNIRDGTSCHFWFDDWLGKGRLIDITRAAGTIYLGVRRHAIVSETVTANGWNIRGQRSRRFQELRNNILAIDAPQPKSGRDVMLWRHGVDDYKDTFSSSKIWDQLRLKRNKVGWYRVVWFP